MNRNFREMLEVQWSRDNFVCIGLDSDPDNVPREFAEKSGGFDHPGLIMLNFNRAIVESTNDLVCAYKPNIAFYEAHGEEGLCALRNTLRHIREVAPNVPVILDAKRADIGNTNSGYVEMAFDYLEADALTVHPYLGAEALQPFLARAEKGIIVLCRTSNPGAGEFQNLPVPNLNADRDISVFEDDTGQVLEPKTIPLYRFVAERVANHWNTKGNCGLVIGATYPDELRIVRELVGDMPILIPGIGAQGGDVEKTVTAGKDSRGRGMIINSSRGIIFASKEVDFPEAARRETEKLRNLVNQYRTDGNSSRLTRFNLLSLIVD